jgi:HPt (histidine-containing phosphotransfer) domain-containing protein
MPDAAPGFDKTVPDEGAFPGSLPGIDLAEGLQRLQGNRKLYRKLLLNFARDYCGGANDIRKALDANDFEHAHSLVHNLKGMAGNLAATGLYAAAMQLEKQVKSSQSQAPVSTEAMNAVFKQLEQTLGDTIEAIKTLSPAEVDPKPGPSAETMIALTPEQAREVAGLLRAAAEMGDVTQLKSIAAELASQTEKLGPISEKINLLAAEFDFDGIAKFADDIEAQNNPS